MMSNTFMNNSRALSRQQLSRIKGGGGDVEYSYCHLEICVRGNCAANGGVPCRCEYYSATNPGVCFRIR
ncbi:hypothetical protein [Chitinophaga nivalis]|uniref:Bacteriocin n=1 Tax=Chitinophaga nivalis TaxID=2991709 RepID=A0ABT3IN69_9BACT|nr:hypothetical protein [Chitinophaga nivalis]MCW3465078.1 hypothetical protein [Chitinophaga nivalis]MCW3485230.1 hypothetical protein [Chitinophaga nivalis]